MINEKTGFENLKRIYAQTDLDAIENNMIQLHGKVNENTRMIAVIKTDGYGHGSVPIAGVLEPLACVFGFAVATPEEAFILRNNGIKKPILILGYVFSYAYEELVKQDIRIPVFREDDLIPLNEACRKLGKKAKVHIKVDTGMGRIGIRPMKDGPDFVNALKNCEYLETEGIFTHFAKADETDKSHVKGQFRRFADFVKKAESILGYEIPLKHCSNSAGILELKEMNLDLVRAGISLYGLRPSAEVKEEGVKLQPALSLFSTITFCKTIDAGDSISYGGTYVADKERRIATVPVGYGDGYPRSLSNKGFVLIGGKKAPIVGRICMDQMMVDVTEIPEAKEGERVTLIGRDGCEEITADMLGDLSGRFNYELVCCIGERVPRAFVKQGKMVGLLKYGNYISVSE